MKDLREQKNKNPSPSKNGFTLLEVLITLGILATLLVLTTQSIFKALQSKQKIQTQIEDMASVRDALRVIEADLNLAFHYRDLEQEVSEEVRKKLAANSNSTSGTSGTSNQTGGITGTVSTGTSSSLQTSSSENNPPVLTPEEIKALENRVPPKTHFIGSENRMGFATMNTSRISESSIQGDFIKVGYELKDCRAPGTHDSSHCLIRRQSPIVEGDYTQGGKETVLMRNVGKFELRYVGSGNSDWVPSWDSLRGQGRSKDAYPEAVEITLGYEVPPPEGSPEAKSKSITMNIVAKIHFPNNKDVTNSGNSL